MNEGTSSDFQYYELDEDNFNEADNNPEYYDEQQNLEFDDEKDEKIDFMETFNNEDIDKNVKNLFSKRDDPFSDSTDRPFQCHVAKCGKRFSRKFDLKRHALVHNRTLEYLDKPFQCPEKGCGKRFVRNHDMTKHRKLHNGERNFKCPICEKAFSRNDNLQSHIKTHSDVNSRNHMIGNMMKGQAHNIPILMPLNELEPENSEDVAETSEIPLDDLMNGPYICDAKDCGMQFERRTAFVMHSKSHVYRRVFQCNTCNRVFSKSSNLTAHMRTHNGERPFHCSCCGLMFARKADRDRHYNRQHLPSDKFKCTEEDCTATFSRKADLGRHMKRHYKEDEDGENPGVTGEEKPLAHSCPKCPEMFRTRAEMRIHKKVHGEIEYCGICGEKFESKTELKEHSKNHVAEDRLKCRVCLRMFSKPANLKAHMTIHTGEKPYSCEECGVKFNRKSVLNKHRKRKHLAPAHKKSPEPEILETSNTPVQSEVKMEILESPNVPETEPLVTVCPYCSSTFLSIENLEDHLKIHEDDQEDVEFLEMEYKPDVTNQESFFKWISCDICGEPFTSEKEHLEHMEEHRESEELELIQPPEKMCKKEQNEGEKDLKLFSQF